MSSKILDERKALCKLINVISEEARNCGGTIFGGAARVKAQKQPAVEAFYEKCEKGQCSKSRYADFKEDPATAAARNAIPNDLDIYFPILGDVGKFISKLAVANLHVVVGVERTQYQGLANLSGEIRVRKLKCWFNVQNLPRSLSLWMRRIKMKVDVVTGPPGMQPPFDVELDLACNGLMISPDNEFRLMPCMMKHLTQPHRRFEALGKLLEDIRARKTQLISPKAPLIRIQKLYKWTIEASNVSSSCEASRLEGEDCFICLQPFATKESPSTRTTWPYIELGCCKKHMHRLCAKNWLDKRDEHSNCPHCGIRNFAIDDKDRRLITAMGHLFPLNVD